MPFNYENIDEIQSTQGQSRGIVYKPEDLNILDNVYGYLRNPEFGKGDYDRVELHLYDTNDTRLFSDHRVTGWGISSDIDQQPQVNLDINKHIRDAGYTSGVFKVVYNFYRDAVGKPIGPKFQINSINSDRTEIRLVPTISEDDDINDGPELEDFYSRYQSLKLSSTINGPYNNPSIPNNPIWTQLKLNFGFNRIQTVVAWVIDDIFPPDPDNPKTILLKLYKPLAAGIKTKQLGWLSAQATQPVIETVILDTPSTFSERTIGSPNFDLCLDTAPRVQTDFRSYNNILGADSDIKSEIRNNISSSLDGVKINIDYSIFENYIHFSSAESRIRNFKYKLNLIKEYDSQAQKYNYSDLSSADVYIYEYTGSHGSPFVKQYQKRWVDKKVDLLNNFDDFEKWLYFESGSDSKYITTTGSRGGNEYDWSRSVITPFPKLSGSFKNDRWTDDYLNWSNDQLFDWAVHSIFIPGPDYELLNTTHSKSNNWFNTSIASASAYDKWNVNNLQKTVPQFISDTGKDANDTYLRFLDMVGHAHDTHWAYTKYFTNNSTRLHNQNYENKSGISDDLIYHVGKSMGINLIEGDPNQELWTYKLGKSNDGFRINNSPTASIRTMTAQQRTAEVWRRLVNNLPFLLKTKGTEMGVRGLINCYGIPEHSLPIYEYGSSKKSEQSTLYKERRFSYHLTFNSQSVATYWGPHQKTIGTVTSSAVTPNAVQMRVWPNPIKLGNVKSQERVSQSIWQVDNDMAIVLHQSHSAITKLNGQPEGLTEFGHFSLVMSSSAIGTTLNATKGYVSASTAKAKIFEKSNAKEAGEGWWTILLNRKVSNNPNSRGSYHSSSMFEYELVAMRGEHGTIDQAVSCSLRVTASGRFRGVDNGYFSSSINNSWSGSLELSKRAYLGGYITSSTATTFNNTLIDNRFGHQFNGSVRELRYYANPINKDTLKDHTLAPNIYASNNGTETKDELLLRLKFDERKNHFYNAPTNNPSASVNIQSTQPDQSDKAIFWDANKSFLISGSALNFPNFPTYGHSEEEVFIDTPELGPNNYTSDKIRQEDNKLVRHLSVAGRAEKPSSERYALDSNSLGIYFSPTDQINLDIFDHIGGTMLDDFIGDAQQAFEGRYIDLQRFNRIYFKKYKKDINKMDYLNSLKLYDMSLFTLLKRYIPARANADLGVVIQPHFLERAKIASRGKMAISGDTKPQNIAINPKSFTKAKAPTDISCAEPEVTQLGFTLQPQTTTGKLNSGNNVNATIKNLSVTTQQHIPVPKKHLPNSTVMQTKIKNLGSGPIIKLANQSKKTAGTGIPAVTQHNASNVVSHKSVVQGSHQTQLGTSVVATKQSNGSTYRQKNLIQSKSFTINSDNKHISASTLITAFTPGWQTSASIDHICEYRTSETRMTNVYHYYSASNEYKAGNVNHGKASSADALISASRGKPLEDGGSVNLFAYSKSLKPAQVSDFNLGGTTGLNRMKFIGTQIRGADFNVDSDQTPDNTPVVSFTVVDSKTLISSDPKVGGNISIE